MFTQSSAEFDELIEEEAGPNRIVILWIIVLGLALLFLPLYLIATTIQEDVLELEAEAIPLQTALASTPAPLLQEQQLADLQAQADQVEALLPALANQDTNWPAVMAAIDDYSPAELELLGLSQTDKQLIIRGRAVDDGAVVDYARRLETSGQFNSVVVQSIALVGDPFQSPTPTATATITPTASATSTRSATSTPTRSGGSGGSATSTSVPATPTAVLYDEYEWDDTQAKPIFLNQMQTHNFYPNFDVDNVFFLAKAGRTYEVFTTGLAPGVDTYLTVTFGDNTLTNDDAEAGVLSSAVTLQAPAGQDVEVFVQITNRGPYGPDMDYQISVLEVVPTPTATSSPTTPTATVSPTATPSPTPDLRDIYEPNDLDPNPIAVGEVQIHNFFPQNDVDKVGFLVKNGRTYQIVTSDLALGVDTFMSVELAGEQWQNDDYDTLGSGNFASAVCFGAESDGTAVATLTNVTPQYTADKTYAVQVQEVPFLTTDKEELTFGPVTQGDPNPPSQAVAIEGTETLDWTAVSDPDWISLDVITGTTPSTLNVSVDISGLAAGTHEGEVTLGWSSFCRHVIPVTVQIDSPRSDSGQETAGMVVRPRFRVMAKPVLQVGGEAVEFVIVVELKAAE